MYEFHIHNKENFSESENSYVTYCTLLFETKQSNHLVTRKPPLLNK